MFKSLKMKTLISSTALLCSSLVHAGTWVNDKSIVQIEARGGSAVSVILDNTDNLCDANRVFFDSTQYINQDGVNQSYSMLLAATSTQKKVSIHVEKPTDGNCYGRIAVLKG